MQLRSSKKTHYSWRYVRMKFVTRPMIVCQAPHNPHTLLLSPPASAPPIPIHTSPLTLPSLLSSLLRCAILASTPNLLPITSPKGIFAPGGCFLHICHTSSFLPSSPAALLPSWAVLLYLGSPIGHVPPPHIPNTLLAVLFPCRGTPQSFLPSFYTP